MPGLKTNEREGTRAVLRHARVSAYKVREVLDLIRGKPVHEAEDILRFSDRDAAFIVGKVLHSAMANAENNDERDPEELYVSACYADEGTTIKRWRPRARGRATRIRKRTCHVTVIVSRLPDEDLRRLLAHRRAEQLATRARRVAGARRTEGDTRSRAERRHPVPVDEHEHEEEIADGLLDEESAESAESAASDETGEGEAEVEADAQDEVEVGEPTETQVAEAQEAAEEAVAEDAEGARDETEAETDEGEED
jgi:large subunit ribosomal protein L22